MSAEEKNNNLITRINYRSQQRAIVNQNEENRNPDIVVSIHQKKYGEKEYMNMSDDYISLDDEKRFKNGEQNELPSCFLKEKSDIEQNELAKKYKEKAKTTKKLKKTSLQKRNLGTGEKHVNDLWYVIQKIFLRNMVISCVNYIFGQCQESLLLSLFPVIEAFHRV